MSLVDVKNALIRPYIALTRTEAPEKADAVHVSVQAFRPIDG